METQEIRRISAVKTPRVLDHEESYARQTSGEITSAG
jgi:hypothetical protein